MDGPIPKRSSERIRRNKPDVPIETIQATGEVEPPKLGIIKPRAIIRDLYQGFIESAQAKYYEPSDWQMIRLNLMLLDEQLKAKKPNGQIISVIMSTFTELLATEGARRRVRIEIERNKGEEEAQVFDVAARFLERQQAQQ